MSDATSNEDTPPETTTEASISPGAAVGKIAGLLSGEGFLSTGEIATLRRVDPDRPVTPALWRLLGHTNQFDAPPWMAPPDWERRWGALVLGMAHVPGLHDYGTPLGEALAVAGWSEMRFVRLMEADAETLPVLLRRMAQYLASKEQRANWDDVRRLLFTTDPAYADDVRLDIARAYYRTLYAQAQDG